MSGAFEALSPEKDLTIPDNARMLLRESWDSHWVNWSVKDPSIVVGNTHGWVRKITDSSALSPNAFQLLVRALRTINGSEGLISELSGAGSLEPG